MDTVIGTVEEFTQRIAGAQESFRFSRSFQALLIDEPKPGTPFDLIGAIGYRTPKLARYKEQHFALAYKNCLRGTTEVPELTVLMRLSAALERRWADQEVFVIDVRLPRALGFSGMKYSYRYALELFPHMA